MTTETVTPDVPGVHPYDLIEAAAIWFEAESEAHAKAGRIDEAKAAQNDADACRRLADDINNGDTQ